MPEILVNLDAVEHNVRVMRDLERRKGFTLLPVLKMIACFPPVADLLRDLGYPVLGVGDPDELTAWPEFAARPGRDSHALICLWPLHRAADVVSRCLRSPVSSIESLRALEGAAASLGLRHSALLMLDLGDYREGIQPEGLPVLLEQIRAERFAHVTLDGLGTTLGCLMGVPPHPGNMADLRQAVETVENILGTPLSLVSLGGSACLEWCMRHPHIPDLPPGCALELRAEAALLLGYDDYRNLPFPEGAFRRDVFRLSCTVLEVLEKNIAPPALRISGGNGFSPLEPGDAGRRIRALVDCGSQNTEVEDLEPELPGARIVGHSANYVVLDVTAVSEPLKVGGRVFFRPGLWAAGRSLRARQVGKRCCRSRKNRVA